MKTNNLLPIILKNRQRIRKLATAHGAIHLRVFGSTIHGDHHPDSDIDFLVTMQPGRDLLDLVALQEDLEQLLQRKADVITTKALSPLIREQVAREAIVL